MKLEQLIRALDEIAPTRLAEPWDNVGLLVGDPAQEVRKMMVAIDYTSAVAAEVVAARCDLIIAYHPPIFHAIKRIGPSNLAFDAIRRGIAIYSPHTALDVADGGTNDVLADILGLTNPRGLRPASISPWHYKLVTYVPTDSADQVARSLFEAGAGHIGNYSHCSFRSDGVGTFLGQPGTHPAIGVAGQLEQVREVRLETITPANRLGAVVAALRASHPYEEPAFDVLQLSRPADAKGMGRIGEVPPLPRRDLIERIRKELAVQHLLVAGPLDTEARTVACLAGDGGSFIDDAIAQRADLYLTGEIKHHDALKAAAAGMTVVCALHSNSERVALSRYAANIRRRCDAEVILSQVDRDPFSIVG